MWPILSIFVIATIILPIFSTGAAAPERSFNCYKYEKKFPDLNIIDPPADEKDVVKCDQCFGYLCYANGEYIFGYGCREDFFKRCVPNTEFQSMILKDKNDQDCSDIEELYTISDKCLKDYCSHERMHKCINKKTSKRSYKKMGPDYTYANITFTQLTTPAPTTTTTTTTTPIPTTKSAFNVDGQSDENNHQNGEKDGHGGSESDPASNNSINFKMFLFAFFGIFMVAYFM